MTSSFPMSSTAPAVPFIPVTTHSGRPFPSGTALPVTWNGTIPLRSLLEMVASLSPWIQQPQLSLVLPRVRYLPPSPPFILINPRISDSTAPFTADQNYQLQYRSGMLQSWNKFCFTTGYIEVSVVLPGPNENTQGYVSTSSSCFRPLLTTRPLQWPGAWTMGNLARPGYAATTNGMWPYT